MLGISKIPHINLISGDRLDGEHVFCLELSYTLHSAYEVMIYHWKIVNTYAVWSYSAVLMHWCNCLYLRTMYGGQVVQVSDTHMLVAHQMHQCSVQFGHTVSVMIHNHLTNTENTPVSKSRVLCDDSETYNCVWSEKIRWQSASSSPRGQCQ